MWYLLSSDVEPNCEPGSESGHGFSISKVIQTFEAVTFLLRGGKNIIVRVQHVLFAARGCETTTFHGREHQPVVVTNNTADSWAAVPKCHLTECIYQLVLKVNSATKSSTYCLLLLIRF